MINHEERWYLWTGLGTARRPAGGGRGLMDPRVREDNIHESIPVGVQVQERLPFNESTDQLFLQCSSQQTAASLLHY